MCSVVPKIKSFLDNVGDTFDYYEYFFDIKLTFWQRLYMFICHPKETYRLIQNTILIKKMIESGPEDEEGVKRLIKEEIKKNERGRTC